MTNVTRAIFPGVLLGCLLILFVSGMTPTPQIVFASTGLELDIKPLKLKTTIQRPQITIETAPSAANSADPASNDASQLLAVDRTVQDASQSPDLTAASSSQPQPSDQTAVDSSQSQPVSKPDANNSATGTKKPEKQSSSDSSGCSLSPSYPASVLQWCSSIQQHARENNLDPNLVAAVITQESGGLPQAYSSSGAVGLMQIMPSDGISAGFMCASGPCFSGRPSTATLENPDYNISYGTRMLAGLVQRNGGIREALRAYGPMNVGYSYADLILRIYSSHE